MKRLDKKIAKAQKIIKQVIKKYPKIAVACSFGKDSMVVAHLVREIDPSIPIFSIMTIFKPKATFKYLVKMHKLMKLEPLTVYMVTDKVPKIFSDNDITVYTLPIGKYEKAAAKNSKKNNRPLYLTNPDLCCKLLKVEATKMAVKKLDAWICGLRNTEGRTRKNYQFIENQGKLAKINPILEFTENDVLSYLKSFKIPFHPWYRKIFPDGKRYRSLGCEPCTCPIFDSQLEREGRWIKTSKCGGECGIHTQNLMI